MQVTDARCDNVGNEWIMHRGATPSISMLLQSLANSRVTLHLKEVETKDNEEKEVEEEEDEKPKAEEESQAQMKIGRRRHW